MKISTLLLLFSLITCLALTTGCDGSSTGRTTAATNNGGSTNPDLDILPYTPPEIPDSGDDDDDPGAGGGAGGGSEPPGEGEQPVPEPSTLLLVGSGVALITLCRKKKQKDETP